jgi:hypothetical protein
MQRQAKAPAARKACSTESHVISLLLLSRLSGANWHNPCGETLPAPSIASTTTFACFPVPEAHLGAFNLLPGSGSEGEPRGASRWGVRKTRFTLLMPHAHTRV